jgi:hypothetical protein
MNDDVTEDIKEMSLIVNASSIDWMMRWICYMLKELYLITYNVWEDFIWIKQQPRVKKILEFNPQVWDMVSANPIEN